VALPDQDLRHVLAPALEVGALPAILAAFARGLQHRAEGDDLFKPLLAACPFSYSLWRMALKVSGVSNPKRQNDLPSILTVSQSMATRTPKTMAGQGMFHSVASPAKH
jgi:hypothetical protein